MREIESGIFKILSIEMKKFNFEQNKVTKINIDNVKSIQCKNKIGAIAKKQDSKEKDQFLIQLDFDIQAHIANNDVYNISTSILSLIEFENKNKENELFLNNAVAIMFSYLRPMIAQITMLSGFPPYHLQPVSFEQFKVNIINNN
ncbi:protein-export chaperone SecB [Campylobacter molothri]|uniref:protein-export chaperone SecB n=1 Tax=Campylobacter molothri TaxID=1032242 RepID=UPI00301DAB8B|nr:protein-export chaperone SecB [Campylobacter sp. RM10534]